MPIRYASQHPGRSNRGPITGSLALTADRRKRSRAQAMTEFAIVAPILFFMLLGIFESGLLLFVVGTARWSTAEVARQESESGNAAIADTKRSQWPERFPGHHAALPVQLEDRRVSLRCAAAAPTAVRDPTGAADVLMGRMSFSANRRNIQLAQSIIELAIATPVLITLLLGAFDVGVMVSDKVIAGAACRQGARLAAEIGGQRTNPSMNQTQADAVVVRNVLAVAQAMNYS